MARKPEGQKPRMPGAANQRENQLHLTADLTEHPNPKSKAQPKPKPNPH